MSAADPQASPSDRGGGSSSTPRAGNQAEVIEVDDSKVVLVITPALEYDMKAEVYALPADTVKAVDHFTVPDGYSREGSRKQSLMYSLGVNVVSLKQEDKHKNLYVADPACRKSKATVTCKKGDRSNVNTHHKSENVILVFCTYGEHESPIASSVYDPRLGFNAVFAPVPSCLSSVILVIYIQQLDMMEHLDMYQDMYGPYVAAVEFYVDGTWCDPRDPRTADTSALQPCYGEQLDRSTVPDGVNVVDKNGGGWMVQRSYIHAVTVPTRAGDHAGYLFMTDDVLLNIGQLSRAVDESGCDVIWRSPMRVCHDVIEESDKHVRKGEVIDTLREESRRFFNQSDEQFRAQLRSNLGSPSKYCLGHQNDFVYMPTSMAAHWARVAQQMTDAGLLFPFTLHAALYGIARMEDMVVLRSIYLKKHRRARSYLGGAEFEGGQQPYCWKKRKGRLDVSSLLAMHIIHPNKISYSTAWNFALTLNPPGAHAGLASQTNNIDVNNHGGGERGPSPFWCQV